MKFKSLKQLAKYYYERGRHVPDQVVFNFLLAKGLTEYEVLYRFDKALRSINVYYTQFKKEEYLKNNK